MRGIIIQTSFAGWKRRQNAGFFFVVRDNEFAVERDGTISMSKNSNRGKEEEEKRCREFIDDEGKKITRNNKAR